MLVSPSSRLSSLPMEVGSSPGVVTSRRRVVYCKPAWSVRQWSVVGGAGAAVCRVAALKMKDSVLLWLAPAEAQNQLQWMVLAINATNGRREAFCSTVFGDDSNTEAASGLARRLSAALAVPVWLSGASAFQPRTLPVVEQALITELRMWLKDS